MSSTFCIDPLLLSSAPAAESWLATDRPASPSTELATFVASLSAASWGDTLGHIHLASLEALEPPPTVPLHHTALEHFKAVPAAPEPDLTSPASTPSHSEQGGSAKRQQPSPPTTVDQKPAKTRRRPSQVASDKRPRRTGKRTAAAVEAEAQESPERGDKDTPSSGDSQSITVAHEATAVGLTQRQRNRLAASKSRRKKDLAVKQLELDERAITHQHNLLLASATNLEAEVILLRSLLLEHQDCRCDNIRKYLSFHERD